MENEKEINAYLKKLGESLITDIRVESGKPLNECKDFFYFWEELTKNNNTNLKNIDVQKK